MNVVEIYSHFNGLEYLQIRKPQLLDEVREAIRQTDDADLFAILLSQQLAENQWKRYGASSNSQTDLVKDRVAVEIQMGTNALNMCSIFAKHLVLYISDQIDVGMEILPMKSLQSQMSSGIANYEGELHNVMHQGRGFPLCR